MKKFQRIGLPILIILLITAPVSSLDQGNVKFGFNEVKLSHNISIKLWGFEDVYSELSEELLNLLPSSMITESQFPNENKIDQYFILSNQAFFGINNQISYTIDRINIINEIQFLTSGITYFANSNLNGGITQTYYDNEVLKNQTGYVIDSSKIAERLKIFNNPSGYTLHLLNLTKIDNFVNNTNSKHWYRSGELQNVPVQSDIRNVGMVGSNGLFYDPSASVPAFDTDYFKSSNFTQIVTTLNSRITDLVENVFIGTPNAFSFNNLEKKAHFDLVIIGKQSLDYSEVLRQIGANVPVSDNYLYDSLSDLLPYLEIETNIIPISLDLILNKNMNDTISRLESQSSNDTSEYIKVSPSVAEELKNLIRDNYHDKWPAGFYYSLFVFVDSNNRKFIWDVNGLEMEYTYGQVGFSTINLAEWKNIPEKNKVSLKQRVLQGFGKMIGISTLNNKFSNQVESAMSTYGITDQWDEKYNQFEIDSTARRVGTVFYNSAIHDLRSLRIDLKEGLFRWLDRSSLDDVELLMRQGQLEYEKGNYSGSTKLYMEGYYDWLEVRDDLIQKQNAFYNGIELTVGIAILLYLISTLKMFTLTKDELYEKFDIEM